MKIIIDDCGELSKAEIADNLRKAASSIAPPNDSSGSKRFKIPAGREIFEYFDGQMKTMIEGLKKDITEILSNHNGQ